MIRLSITREPLGALAFLTALFLASSPAANAQTVPAGSAAQATEAPDPCRGLLGTTDRPTFGTNPCVVKHRTAQIEAGYQNLTTSTVSGNSTTTYPNARVRLGVARNVEVVIDVPTSIRRSALFGGPPDTNFGNLGTGLKWEFGHSARFVHGIAGEVVFPTAGAGFGTGLPSFNGSYQAGYGILPRLGVGITLGFNEFATPADQTTIARLDTSSRNPSTLAFTPAFAVGGLIFPTTKITVEIAQNSGTAAFSNGATFGDVFIQQLITPTVLIDANAGQRFNALPGGAHQHYLGAGASVRL